MAASPLVAIEPRLRALLPADLYAAAWLDPSAITLIRVFEHLRTLQRILQDYVPLQVAMSLPHPGETRFEWQRGTLMFTDLAGFTPLMEASAALGRIGAETLLNILNAYFADSKRGSRGIILWWMILRRSNWASTKREARIEERRGACCSTAAQRPC